MDRTESSVHFAPRSSAACYRRCLSQRLQFRKHRFLFYSMPALTGPDLGIIAPVSKNFQYKIKNVSSGDLLSIISQVRPLFL